MADIVLQRQELATEGRESPSESQAKKTPQMRVTYANRTYGHGTTASSGVAPTAPTWRNFSNPQGGQRGLMEKFLLSRGRLNGPATFNAPTPSSTSSPSTQNHSVVTPGSSAGDPVGVIKAAPAPVRYLPPAVKPIEIVPARKEEVC